MARYFYDRLSDSDARLLDDESSRSFSHIGMVLVFEAGPLGREDGGVDFPAIRRAVECCLERVPHYRRKLRRVPVEGHPVWVDDREFNLDYHLRHTSLARPGGPEELRRLVARVQSQRLDRSRALWECWVAEGLEGGRFALILKVHSSLAPRGAPDLLEALLSPDPSHERAEPGLYRPRPMPTPAELARDELVRQARLPRQWFSSLTRWLTEQTAWSEALQEQGSRFAAQFGYAIRPERGHPLRGEVGPHRRFDSVTIALDEARAVRDKLGGTVNDVVLAIVSGAISTYLNRHLWHPATVDFVAAMPVVQDDPTGTVGRWTLELPVWEADPVRRLELIRERTQDLHRSRPGRGARAVAQSTPWTGSRGLVNGVRAVARSRSHLRIVNVPGPQRPLHLCGARLAEAFGEVPLDPRGGLGVSVTSYDGNLHFGLNADFDLVPDLDAFSRGLEDAFRELLARARRETLEVVPGGNAG